MKLYITRHGQTDWNLEGRKQGRSDIPLNQTGIKEAEKLGDKIRDLKIDVCYTSPLQRASDTAHIAIKEKCEIIPDSRLIERSFGEYEGQILSFKNGDIGVDVNDYSAENLPGGIETPKQIIARAQSFLEDLKRNLPDDSAVLLVLHGQISKAFIFLLENKPNFENIKHLDNCEIIKYEI